MLIALSVTIALVVALAVSLGPVGAGRLIRFGDTTIGDFADYPGRAFPASPNPQPWPTKLATTEPVVHSPVDDSEIALSQLVADSDTIAFIVAIDGVLHYEAYAQGHGPSEISQLFSVSKSVLSLMVGAAIDDGIIGSVDDPLTDYLPETSPGLDGVTLEDLLRMASGTNYAENDNPFGEHVRFNFTDRLEEEILAIQASTPPGEVFEYRSGDNALLSLALTRALGEATLTDYLSERIWSRIGSETGGVWSVDRADGLERSWCCLATTARDLTRIGQLVLNNGAWDGQQVIPSDWIQQSTSGNALQQEQLPDWFRESPLHSYGYQWWLVSEARSDIIAIGKDGQYLYIDPSRAAVMVRLGWSSDDITTPQWIEIASQAIDQLGG